MNISWRLAMSVLLISLCVIVGSAFGAAGKPEVMDPLTTWERALEKFQSAGQFIADEEWKEALECLANVGRDFPPVYAKRALLMADLLERAISLDQEQAKQERFRILALACVGLEAHAGAVKYYRAALQVDGKLCDSDATALLTCMEELKADHKEFEALAKEYPQPRFREWVEATQQRREQPRGMDDNRWEPVNAVFRTASLTNLKRLKEAAAESTLAGRQADAYQHIANGLRERGDLVGAEAWEAKLIAEVPESLEHIARLHYSRGNELEAEGNWAEAERWFRSAADTFPKSRQSENARMMLAIALEKQGKQLEAVQECLVLLDKPTVPDVELVNVRDKEFVEVEKGQRYRENLHGAATLISKIYEKQGNLSGALKFARLAHEEFPLRSFCGTCDAQSKAASRKRVAELRKKNNDERVKQKNK